MIITILKGLPASGKSTWAAKNPGYVVNRDKLRDMFNKGFWDFNNAAKKSPCLFSSWHQLSKNLKSG